MASNAREAAEYKRGYANGYNTRASKWPKHRPPLPPEPLLSNLIQAAQKLRDAVDGQLALFDPEDEIQNLLGPKMDEFDEAMAEISEWLRRRNE